MIATELTFDIEDLIIEFFNDIILLILYRLQDKIQKLQKNISSLVNN